MASNDPTQKRLKALLHYDHETGVFTWKERPGSNAWNRRYAGKVAGCVHKTLGYVGLLDNWAHRLAWIYMKGKPPKGEIDHRDTVRSNNRFKNLRDVHGDINRQNHRTARNRAHVQCSLGVHFVSRLREKPFCSSIRSSGRSIHIGYFRTDAEAHSAYVLKKRELHAGNTL